MGYRASINVNSNYNKLMLILHGPHIIFLAILLSLSIVPFILSLKIDKLKNIKSYIFNLLKEFKILYVFNKINKFYKINKINNINYNK